jgi:hypothetical protein
VNPADNEIKTGEQTSQPPANGASPILNLSKNGNDQNSVGEQSDHSELHSQSVSNREDYDNFSEGNVSEVDEASNKEEDGEQNVTF